MDESGRRKLNLPSSDFHRKPIWHEPMPCPGATDRHIMLSTTAQYRLVSLNVSASIDRLKSTQTVRREVDYYLANIGNVHSIDDFLKDRRLFTFAMRAHGLQDMTFARAYMRKVLEEGVDKSDTFARNLTDRRFQDFATTFNFARYKEAATSFARAQQGTVDRFLRLELESQAGASNEGVRLALNFARLAPGITSSVELMADRALLRVVQVAFQIPDSTLAGNLDKAMAEIDRKLDVADLKDPKKLAKVIDRFTSLWELQRPSSGSGTAAAVGSFAQGPIGLQADLLVSLQQIKRG